MSVVKGSLLDKGANERILGGPPPSSQHFSFSQPFQHHVLQQSQPLQQLQSNPQLQSQQPQQSQQSQQSQQQQQPLQRTTSSGGIVRQASQSSGSEPPSKRNRPKALTLDMNPHHGHGQLGLLVEAALNSPSDTLPGSTVTIRSGRQCRVPTLSHQSAHIRAALYTALSQQQANKEEGQQAKQSQGGAEPMDQEASAAAEAGAQLAKPAPTKPDCPVKPPSGGSEIRRSNRSAFRSANGIRRTRSTSLDYRSFGLLGTPLSASFPTPIGRGMQLPIPSSPLPLTSPFLIPSVPLGPLYGGSPFSVPSAGSLEQQGSSASQQQQQQQSSQQQQQQQQQQSLNGSHVPIPPPQDSGEGKGANGSTGGNSAGGTTSSNGNGSAGFSNKSHLSLLTAAAASTLAGGSPLMRTASVPSVSTPGLFAPFSPGFPGSPSMFFGSDGKFLFPNGPQLAQTAYQPGMQFPTVSSAQFGGAMGGGVSGGGTSNGGPFHASSQEGGLPIQRSFSTPSSIMRPAKDGSSGMGGESDEQDALSESSKTTGSRRRSAVDDQWPSEWLEMPCVQFNRLMKTCSLSAEQITELKKARRRKKNRTYAKRSRDKKNAKIEETMAKYQALENSIRQRQSGGPEDSLSSPSSSVSTQPSNNTQNSVFASGAGSTSAQNLPSAGSATFQPGQLFAQLPGANLKPAVTPALNDSTQDYGSEEDEEEEEEDEEEGEGEEAEGTQ